MAINIKFDLAGNPEPPTIILANKNGKRLGQLNVDEKSIELNDKFNDVSEFSFTIYKKELSLSESETLLYHEFLKSSNNYTLKDIEDSFLISKDSDGSFIISKELYELYLWDKITDFKLVCCKEWDEECFEIKVELDENTETIKTVFCTQLGQSELSQINLYNYEINTEEDIARDDYKITILYDGNDPEASLLDRILEKAPHYSIAHVDPTIAKIQRSFSFDGSSICEAHEEISEEIGCLFVYSANYDANRKLQRTISVYDLQQNCIDCGYRGDFIDTCPKCGSKNIKYGYGQDTTIFVTADELASGGIQLNTDTESVKNCFKLEAGDDLMTATVRNCNPNGTDYIWRFSDSMKEGMSVELVDRMKSYDDEYTRYCSEYESEIDNELLSNYNTLVDKYVSFNENLQKISTPIEGYSSLMNAYYNTIDLELYLKSGLMPSVEIADTDAKEQAALLTASSLSPIAVTDVTIASLATINSTVLSMAKIIVRPTFKVQVNSSEIIDDINAKYWKGNFIITNYSDEEDTAISEIVSVYVSDDYESFVKQKIEKALSKEDTDDVSITGLFEKEYDSFCAELKKYALNPLVSFRDACQACIDILIEQGIGNDETWGDTDEGASSNLYEKLYVPYYNKLKAIESEIKIRENEIAIISGIYDLDGNLIVEGLQFYIEKNRNQIQSALDFEKYLGSDLWLEFCAYRREDKYSNENYISDGLNNAELFKRALEFFEVAENEIYKASELQHSISTTLKNLLAIKKFKPLVKSFNLGNWIRVRVDNKIYKLRLLEYGISFGDFEDIPVEFSDVTKVKNGITDVESVLSQASSIASSYDSVKRQASQGEKSSAVLNSWVDEGLNATNTKIISTENQNQVWDKNGFLCREYDPISETYSDEQLKIINSSIFITNDNWETTKTAVGKYFYVDPKTEELKMAYGVNGETIIGKFILGENMLIQNESGNMVFDGDGLTITSTSDDGVGTMTFNENGLVVNHGDNTVTISPKSEEVMNITNGEEKVFEINENGELSINGNIIARSLRLESGVTIDSGIITNLATVAVSGLYNDLLDTPTKLSEFENDNEFITKNTDNLTNYYKKSELDNALDSKVDSDSLADVATSGLYDDLKNTPTFSTVANTGSYNDLVDIEELKNWVVEQIQSAIGS